MLNLLYLLVDSVLDGLLDRGDARRGGEGRGREEKEGMEMMRGGSAILPDGKGYEYVSLRLIRVLEALEAAEVPAPYTVTILYTE